MELERCRALLFAIDKQSLSAAADALGYTPSGVSRMMAALEEELGFPLLLRSRSGVAPTPECEQLLPALRSWVHQGECLKQAAAKISHVEVGTLTVGAAYSSYYRWLADKAAAFRRQHPGVRFRFISGYSTELLEKLHQHQADLAVISRREGEHFWLPLCQKPLLAMVPAQSELAKLAAVPAQTFASHPYIDTYHGRDVNNARYFRRCHVQPNTQYTTTDIYVTCEMVKAGLGLALTDEFPPAAQDESLCLLPLDPAEQLEIGIAAGPDMTPACQAFFSFLKQQPKV